MSENFLSYFQVGTSTMLKHFLEMIPKDERPLKGRERDMVRDYLSLQIDGPSIR